MRIVGERMESASVVPNRTVCAMRDMACLLRVAQDDSVSDKELLELLAREFRRQGFSEMLKPLSSVLDQEEQEIATIYVSCALLTFLDSHAKAALFAAFLIIRSFEERTKTTCSVPLLLGEIEDLTTVCSLPHFSSPLTQRVGKFVALRIRPVVRRVPLYLDHSGFENARDNLKESDAKQLALGEETDRTVRIEPLGQGEVVLVDNADDEPIFHLRQQTAHSREFRKAVGDLFRELENIIPPPAKPEHEPERLAMLPSRQVKALLKSGFPS